MNAPNDAEHEKQWLKIIKIITDNSPLPPKQSWSFTTHVEKMGVVYTATINVKVKVEAGPSQLAGMYSFQNRNEEEIKRVVTKLKELLEKGNYSLEAYREIVNGK